MKAKQEDVVKEREKELARKQKEQEKLMKKEIEAKQAKKKEQRDKVCSSSCTCNISYLSIFSPPFFFLHSLCPFFLYIFYF